jgi:hypothetical protein
MPRTCLAAFLDGDVKNVQHGLADDPDMTEEGKASPAANEFVLPIFCGGGVDCCCSSSCRKALRCSLVAARRWKSDGLLWLPSPELGSGGGGCKVLKAEGGVGRLASGIDSLLLAAAEGAEPFCEHAGPGEGKAKSPVRAGFREIRGTTVPLPMDAAKLPQLAVEPIGVSGFFGEANNVLVLVGVSGPSDGAANTKPPFAVGPVAVGVLGAAKNAKTPVAGFGACPSGLKNDDETLLDSDPAGVLAALPANLNMFLRSSPERRGRASSWVDGDHGLYKWRDSPSPDRYHGHHGIQAIVRDVGPGGGWRTLTKINYVEWAAVMRVRL